MNEDIPLIRNFKLPISFTESNDYQRQNEEQLISNLIAIEDENQKLITRKIIKNVFDKSGPSNDKIGIYKGNLIFALRQKIYSFKISDYFLKEQDSELITVDETELTTLHDSQDSQIVRIEVDDYA